MIRYGAFQANMYAGALVVEKKQGETKMEEQKKFVPTLLLSIFVGVFGGHRFYTGHIGTGVAQLLTLGGLGFWALYDLIMIVTGKFKDSNGNFLEK
jgi:TM2 domain-containing membrane protein YozV